MSFQLRSQPVFQSNQSAKEKCCEILAFADAEWKDASDRGYDLCPVLNALKSINPRKAVPKLIYLFVCHWFWGYTHLHKIHDYRF